MQRGPVQTATPWHSSGRASEDGGQPAAEKPGAGTGHTSIAPVGLEMADVDGRDEESPAARQTGSLLIPLRRRRLRGIVIGALAGCALILVAAVIARVSQASSAPQATKASDTPAAATADPPKAGSELPAPPPSAAAAAANPPAETAATGTLRLERPAAPGRVWLDGKKLTTGSALVSCGAHQVKVGAHGRAHGVQVPCGGELVVSR